MTPNREEPGAAARPPFSLMEAEVEAVLRKHCATEQQRQQLRSLILQIQNRLYRQLRQMLSPECRRQANEHIEKVVECFGDLADLVAVRDAATRARIMQALAPELGRSLSGKAFELADLPQAEHSVRLLAPCRLTRDRDWYAAAESELAAGRREIAAWSGDIVLAALLRRCGSVLARMMRQEPEPRSGNPGRADRNLVLNDLAGGYAQVFDAPPTSTVNGAFERLAADVLELFGLDTTGLDQAIKRCLKHPQRSRASGVAIS